MLLINAFSAFLSALVASLLLAVLSVIRIESVTDAVDFGDVTFREEDLIEDLEMGSYVC